MEKQANPAVLGLLGYGMSTVLLSLINSGLVPFDGMMIAMRLATRHTTLLRSVYSVDNPVSLLSSTLSTPLRQLLSSQSKCLTHR